MTYDEAIAFWYGRINYEVRSAAPKDLKLERMRALVQALGSPDERLRIVHVTGTKGKGSTSAMLASILQQAGYRVGLFTSPHLEHVEERLRVNFQPVSQEELTALIAEIAPIVRGLDQGPWPALSFFEISTALGFLHFVRRRCDWVVLEVGLGGRFDSTNICKPRACLITNIGFDHMAQLGNTLAQIAYQKAGIIKRGIPVISGVDQPEARAVVRQVSGLMYSRLVEVPVHRGPTDPHYTTNLLGEHQQHNARLAVAAVRTLQQQGLPVPEAAILRGLAQVPWPARIELLGRKPWVILDTAHNVPSIEALIATLKSTCPQVARKRVIFAVSNDKQYQLMLQLLEDYFDEIYLTKYGNNPRCVSPDKLREFVQDKSVYVFQQSLPAVQAAYYETGPEDLLCVTGSVFLASELASTLREITSAR